MSTSADTTRSPGSTTEGRRVVLAIGGASTGAGAARWAAAEAARLAVPLKVVGAVPVEPNPAPLHAPDVAAMQRHEESTRTRLEAVADDLPGPATVLPVEVAQGSPAATVLALVADDTSVVVLGHRTLSPAQRLLEGSTSTAVAGRSPVPVAVVPDTWTAPADDHRPIVVGVSLDGIDGAYRTDADVLTTAFERARALRAPVTAVHAWQVPALLSWSPADITSFGRRVRTAVEEVLAPWAQRYPDVVLTTSVVAGRAADAVEDASTTAQVVVLGRHTPARRHRGFHLGSTTRESLHHVHAPVLVVPVAHPAGDPRPAREAVWAPMF